MEIHHDYFHDIEGEGHDITQLVRKGQEMLVQVVKDPIMHKGAMLTTNLSLAGRLMVLMPGNETYGISRKIEDEQERQRLKDILNTLNVPEGFGVIVRTIAEGATKTALTKDFNYLMRLWKTIKSRVMEVESPHLLYKERNLVVRTIRDYFTTDVSEILVDDAAVYHEIKDFMKII